MQALVDLVPLVDVGLGGLVAAGLILVLTGRLLPSSTVEKLLASRDKIIEQQAATIARQDEQATTQAGQITALLESGRTTAHALEEIRRVAEQGPGEDV